jgi:RNA polymerase sigma-70 factor, ECF subfamily
MHGSASERGERSSPATLEEAWQRAGESWPDLSPTQSKFRQAFADCWESCRLTAGTPPVFVEDVYLVQACLKGISTALRAFEARHMSQVPSYVSRFAFSEADLADVEQSLRVRLLTGPRPKLASYTGVGPLSSWLKVTAMRTALNLVAARQAGGADVEPEDMLVLVTTDLPSVEQKVLNLLMTETHRELVREVLGDALASLSDHEKTVLRMYLLDGIAVHALARVFAVHRATVARWLGSIRAHVLEIVNDRLACGSEPPHRRCAASFESSSLI